MKDSKLEPLAKILLGTWKMTGRTHGAPEDNMEGELTTTWMSGKRFLKLKSDIRSDEISVESTEIIRYDEKTGTFPAEVFADLSYAILPYEWAVAEDGKSVTHTYKDSTYHGTVSDDGNVIDGEWKPKPGEESNPGNHYRMTMTRVN